MTISVFGREFLLTPAAMTGHYSFQVG